MLFFSAIYSDLFSSQNNIVEKEIVVVIPSYNNKEYYEKNLGSALGQEYSNFTVLYYDDCSTDGTGQLVQEFIEKYDHKHRVTLIRNEERKLALANHWAAAHSSSDHAIIVNLDGDDWFAHKHALQRINQEYQDSDVWLTYGQFRQSPSGVLGSSCLIPMDIIERNAFREHRWSTSQPRTYYAWLFKKIKCESLFFNGDFIKSAWDLAFMFPMLEMAGFHIRFIPDVLYIYNKNNPINDYKIDVKLQLSMDRYIRSQPKYMPLDTMMAVNGVKEKYEMMHKK